MTTAAMADTMLGQESSAGSANLILINKPFSITIANSKFNTRNRVGAAVLFAVMGAEWKVATDLFR